MEAASVFEARDSIREFVSTFEPGCYSGEDAAKLVAVFNELKRMVSFGLARASKRVEETRLYERDGHKRPATHLAGVMGEAVGQASALLDLAKILEAHPETAEAFSKAEISETQVRVIASVGDQHPERVAELVDAARRLNFGDFKKRCDDVRNQSDSEADAAARYESMRKRRYCKTWTDAQGFGRLEARMTPDALDVIRNGLGPFQDQIFQAARKEGSRDSYGARTLDALVAMAAQGMAASADGLAPSGDGTVPSTDGAASSPDVAASSPDVAASSTNGTASSLNPTRRPRGSKAPAILVRARIDINALIRGYAEPGEVCEIIDGGAIPPSFISAHLADCIFELIATKGKEVHSIVTDSRHIARVINIALEERDRTCSVPGCEATFPLESDHWRIDYRNGGQTKLDNLLRICRHHHYLKTNKGWRFEGEPGNLRFIGPDSRVGGTGSINGDLVDVDLLHGDRSDLDLADLDLPSGDPPTFRNGCESDLSRLKTQGNSGGQSPPTGAQLRRTSMRPPDSGQEKLL